MRKKLPVAALLGLFAFITLSADKLSVQEQYVRTYSKVAVSEMYRSGIPASITLAQGLLESGAGKSRLATEANNHFGIKCHNNWTGDRIYHDDDQKGECFRKYRNASDSFRDHSDFLRYKDRYKFLFDLEITDYKGWATGLKKAGYATDPAYSRKLIKIIEDYRLYEYDAQALESYANSGSGNGGNSGSGSSGEVSGGKDNGNVKAGKANGTVKGDRTNAKGGKADNGKVNSGKEKNRGHKNGKSRGKDKTSTTVPTIPLSPRVIEEPKLIEKSQLEEFHFNLSRQLYSQNGVPFVYSIEGETYASIAAMYNLFLREILSYNDLKESVPLNPGTVVYLQRKKKQAAKGLDKHVWEKGETLYGISQRYGIRLSNLMNMNGIKSEDELIEGDLINLRK